MPDEAIAKIADLKRDARKMTDEAETIEADYAISKYGGLGAAVQDAIDEAAGKQVEDEMNDPGDKAVEREMNDPGDDVGVDDVGVVR